MKIPSLDQIWQSFVVTFKRFPIAVIASVVGTIIAIHAIENHLDDVWVMRVLFTASLSVFFFTALTLGSEVIKKISREFVIAIGVILMVFYYFSLPELPDFAGSKFLMRQVFLVLASFVAIVWAPFWKEKVKNEVIWEWVRRIIMNLVQTVFFGVIIFAGIAAAIFAIDSLFGLNIEEIIYAQIWAAVVGAFGPIHFLSNLDQNPRKLKLPKPIPAFMKILTKYILTPLAVGYFLILYTYTFKVLITWEWPKNVLGWLVIGFSVVAVFTYFLWTPFWKEKIAKYRRLFWWGLLPQVAMLFLAIGWRIQVYSWTENRYFVVILGLWLLGIAIYFLINKKATFKSIFIALTAIILISQIGPLSGYSVGERAQQNRLIKLLKSSQILQNGEIIPAKIELDKQIRYEISDTIDYLIDQHGREAVSDIFPKILAKLEDDKELYRYSLAGDITKELGFGFISDWKNREGNRFLEENMPISLNIEHNAPRNIAGYDWFIQSINKNNDDQNTFDLGERKIEIRIDSDDDFLEIWEGKTLLEKIDFTDFFAKLVADYSSSQARNQRLGPNDLAYEYDGEGLRVKIFFDYINIRDGGVEHYFNPHLYLSFKKLL